MKVSHLTPLIFVFDMPTSLAFYRDILGFEVAMQSQPGNDFGWGLLRMGGAELMLNTAYDADERPAAPDAARRAAHSDTTLYFGCPNVDEAYEYLRSKGVPVEKPAVTYYGMKQLTVTDPDGYGLCFQHPAKDT
jgi:catechol 2,3-dioxygenase-like lactoylglutathione lyase family enzyme